VTAAQSSLDTSEENSYPKFKAMTPALTKLIQEIETMLPLYAKKETPGMKTAVGNLQWNLKKLRHEEGAEPMDAKTWLQYTRSDFAKIASELSPEEPGAAFAKEFEARSKDADADVTNLSDPEKPSEPVPAPGAASAPNGEPPIAPAGGATFDLRGFLQEREDAMGEKLQWETSIVDLMKVVGLDPSLSGRRQLGTAIGMSETEVGEIGTESGNIALHDRFMQHLAASGGAIPNLA